MRSGVLRWFLYAVSTTAIVILVGIVIELRQAETTQAEEALRADADIFTQRIEATVELAIAHSRSVRALFESSNQVTEREFARFIIRSGFLTGTGYVRAIAAMPVLMPSELETVEAAIRDRAEERRLLGYPPFKGFAELAQRAIHAPVVYVETNEAREDIVGYDIAASPERWNTALAAMITSQPHMTPPVRLSQDAGSDLASVLIISAAVSGGDLGLRGPPEPGKSRKIIIASSYSPSLVIGDLLDELPVADAFAVKVEDITDERAFTLYESDGVPPGATATALHQLVLGNRVWSLSYFPAKDGADGLLADRFTFLGIIGAILILALTVALDRLIRGRGVLEAQVQERTEQLRSLNMKLATAAQQANQESEAKSRFLAHMSHELRTPLNAVIGYAQMLTSEVYGKLGSPQYAEYARTIEEAGKIQLELVEDILSLAALQSGRREFERRPMNLESVVGRCIDMVRNKATEGDVHVELTSLLSQAPFIGDERAVQQIVLNLLSNAIKFTPAGGSVIVYLARDRESTVTVTVRDTGIGIAPEHLETVMQPFGQAGINPYNTHEGVGLGLSIVKGLVDAAGGTLDLESTLGEGTVVTVTLPSLEVDET